MKSIKKLLSSLLIISMLVTSVQTEVFAEQIFKADKSKNSVEDQPNTSKAKKSKKEPKIIKEITEKRNANTKVFLRDDLSYEAVTYPQQIHYLDNNGQWQDINNSLQDAADDSDTKILNDGNVYGSGTEDEGSKSALENTKNDFKIKIAKNTKSSKLVSVKKGDYELSWNLLDANNVKAQKIDVDQNEIESSIEKAVDDQISKDSILKDATAEEKADIRKTKIENEKIKTLTNIESSKILFTDIYPNIDIQYNTIGDALKENIVINDKIDNPVFKFNLNVKNLIPKLDKDNNIIFYDSRDASKIVYKTNAPYMYDASKAESNNVKVSLDGDSKSGYILTLSPDTAWINDPSRKMPITIDPTVQTSQNINSIHDTFVASSDTSNKYLNQYLRVGQTPGIGSTRTYMKFDLPTLQSGDMITAAQLNLEYCASNSSGGGQVNVHQITQDFDPTNLYWSNQPSYVSTIEDYAVINSSSDCWVNWDITSIAKKWYTSGNNYGLMLEQDGGGSAYNSFYSSDWGDQYTSGRPIVSLHYVNNSGLESYWTYHSASAGSRAGTGYVNDYNGNLVFIHDDLSMNGNRMPVNIKHVYNSNDRLINRIDTNITSSTTAYYGPGWRLNLSQRVIPMKINGTQYYQYIDEDGTRHYFYYDSASSTWKDESGINLTLAINYSFPGGTGYCITDKKDNKLIFTSSGFLYLIQDANGNKTTLNYNGAVLSKITDGANRVTIIDSTPDGVLAGIIDPSGRRTSFAYNGAVLSRITYPDGKYTVYYYDSNNNLTSATNYDGNQLIYNYYSSSPYRVSSVSQNNTDGTQGGSLAIAYGNNETTFTDFRNKVNTYQFNNCGNTVSVKNADNSAMYNKFANNDTNSSDSSKNNQLSLDSKLQSTVINYLQNHNAEYSDSTWSSGYWGSGPWGANSITTEDKYLGSKSFKIAKTTGAAAGVCNWQFYSQTLTNLQKGGTYTLSGYIKTNSVTGANNGGALLFANYADKTGSYQTVNSNPVTGTSDWQRYQVTFTIPSDSASNTVYIEFGIANETGTAYYDSLQLEKGSIANRYNMVENPDFMYGGAQPNYWSKSSTCDSYDYAMGAYGKGTFRINGYSNKSKNISQTINVSGNTGDSFVVSGWAMADSVPISSGRYFALDVVITNTDNTTQWQVIPFNQGVSDWQYSSDVIVAKQPYKNIIIYAIYYNNANTAFFSDLQLYKEEFGQSYQYDSKGNVISTKDLAKQNSTFGYNGNNDLISKMDPKGNQFTYEYDNNDLAVKKHNITKATSAENVVYSFSYDSSGNPLTSKVGNSTLFIQSSATYTTDGNYVKTITDSSGNTASYNYNLTKGTLDSETDPKGYTTSYNYDPNLDRLSSVSKVADGQTITNSYGYYNDKIQSITHNGFSYSFGYDSLGNNTTVSVGNQNLITNKYEPKTSNLLNSTYGNGQIVSNAYDGLDRVISRGYNGSTLFTYQYDGSGNLGYLGDLVNQVNYNYIYDNADRLVKVQDSKGNVLSYEFDKNNNTSKVVDKVNNNTYTTVYDYDKDNKPKTVKTNSGTTVTWNYDSIARLNNKTIGNGTTNFFTTSYSYKDGINNSTTAKVKTITNNNNTITYDYDFNGNIKTISNNGKLITYSYNELNELIREDNQVLNKTIVYGYDAGGNIQSKKEYPYSINVSNANLPASTNTVNYTYGDTNWKDKLTSFNGKSINYDAIGNPINYNGYTYTWERGRELAATLGNGQTINYKYNDDGIRTQKTVNGVTTNYHLVGDKVTYEDNGTDKIYYTYDATGHLVSMNLNGVEYYYVRNAQGDIIGLFDGSGTQVVSYTYDSWGKLVSIDGTLKDSVGVKNPYRYRGYRYDTETGLYYLQSRYYNPDWGRFINADGLVGTPGKLLSSNMFAYCANNPINSFDPTGFKQAEGCGGGGLGDVLILALMWASQPSSIDAVDDAIGTALSAYNFAEAMNEKQEERNIRKQNDGNNKNNKNNKKDKDKSGYKNYDAKQIEKKYGMKKGQFHQIKQDILTDARRDFPKDMKRVGDNPDIHLNDEGLMEIVSRTNNYSFPTYWDIQSFLPK